MNDPPATLNPPPPVRLHIERVVLDGFPAGSVHAPVFQAALQEELVRLLTRTRARGWTSPALARAEGAAARLSAPGDSAAWGREIARAVMARWAPPSAEGSSAVAAVHGSNPIG